jgi:hypothetical protein
MRSCPPEHVCASYVLPASHSGLQGKQAASAMALHATTKKFEEAYLAEQLSCCTVEQFWHTASCVALHPETMYCPEGHFSLQGLHSRLP